MLAPSISLLDQNFQNTTTRCFADIMIGVPPFACGRDRTRLRVGRTYGLRSFWPWARKAPSHLARFRQIDPENPQNTMTRWN